MNKLKEVNLKLNAGKCQYLKKSIVYLGHNISDKGVLSNNTKIEAIKKYPVPKNVDEVKRFVAMLNYYRRHIKDFAKIARPLNHLTRKDVEFIWDRCV